MARAVVAVCSGFGKATTSMKRLASVSFLETDRRIPVANTPGSQASTSLVTSLPSHWAQILVCRYLDSDCVQVAQLEVRAQQCFCQT